MASTPRPAIPAPQIFNSDPIEQTYAKGTLDPQMGGIAYAYLNAARGDRANDQDVYMKSLASAQNLQAQLQQQEMQHEDLQTLLKEIGPTVNAGVSPSDIPMYRRIMPGGNPTGDPSALRRALLMSEANAHNAAAAHAGDAGAPVETVQRTIGSNGEVGDTVLTSKGKAGAGTGAVMGSADTQAQREKAFRAGQTGGGAGVRPSIGTATQTALEKAQGNHPNSPIR